MIQDMGSKQEITKDIISNVSHLSYLQKSLILWICKAYKHEKWANTFKPKYNGYSNHCLERKFLTNRLDLINRKGSQEPHQYIHNKSNTGFKTYHKRTKAARNNSKYHYYVGSVENKLSHQNNFPCEDLQNGWTIDSGASAHMNPFHKDCENIRSFRKVVYLADGSKISCHKVGDIVIPMLDNRDTHHTLRLKNVLIIPELDRRLFSVISFLTQGNCSVNFKADFIKLITKSGPKIKIPMSSLLSPIQNH